MRTIKLIGKQVSQIDFKKLIEYDIKSWLDINEKTISYIQYIKDKLELALLSNMTFNTLQEIGNMYWLDCFKLKIFSCEKKVAKPHPSIYEICLEELNVSPQQQKVLCENTARDMGDIPKMIKTRYIGNCFKADPDCGKGVAEVL